MSRRKSAPSVFDSSCSARHALELIASKWAILVLSALRGGPMRNGALLTGLGKSLSETLAVLDRWAELHFPQLDAARARYLALSRSGPRG
jgi:DNA-binding HxlR family transcriptional regulator